MRRLAPYSVLLILGCGPSAKPTNNPTNVPQDASGADGKSGPDGKRSGANALKVNTPVTDEVNTSRGDKTDWFKLELAGKPGVLATQINWDNPKSDIMIDAFDALGGQIAASPVRAADEQLKKLLVPIDKPGTFYLRITAPGANDGSVYTLEAKWDEPAATPPPPPPPPPDDNPPPVKHHHEPREPKPVTEKPDLGGSTLQGRIVSAYREGEGLTLQIDKGSAQGVKTGMAGAVLSGPSGEDPLDGAAIKVTSVLGPNKCLAKTASRSIGKNNRVMITLGR